jgi:hypothetical protein
MGKLGWFGAPSIGNRGNVAVGLAVAAGIGLAVTGVLLTQSVNQSLRKIASSEGEQVLVNFAKKKAAITAAMSTSPCMGTTATSTFTAEPPGSTDSGLQSRCFVAGSEKILQACKVCTPGAPGYQVVSVQLPAPEVGVCGAAGANWVAYSYSGLENSYIYLSPWPAVEWTVGSRKLYTLDSQRVFRGGLAAFQADPIAKIQSTPDLPRGQARNQTLVFDVAQLMVESASTQATFLDGFAATSSSTSIGNRFMCSRNRANDTNCYSNSGGAWMGALSSSSAEGPFFVSASGSNSAVTFVRQYREIGRYCACTRLSNLHPNFDYVESRMAPYLIQAGNMNIQPNDIGSSADEMRLPELNLVQKTDTVSDRSTFPDDAVWSMVRQWRGLPSDVELIGMKRSRDYMGGVNGSIRRVYSFTSKFSDGHIEEVLTGTEHNNTVGRKIYLVGNQYLLQTVGCSSKGHSREIQVFTNTISRFGGRWTGTYDDFRGAGYAGVSTASRIQYLCSLRDSTYLPYDSGEVAGWNYQCLSSAAPTRHFHNGSPIDNNGGGGQGWCANTAVEWVRCRQP